MFEIVQFEGLKNQAAFERLLAERFPDVAGMIDDVERGLLHMEMAVLAGATREAIYQGDFQIAGSHLAFVDELFSGSFPDLENAIYVSYLENVFLGWQDDRFAMARDLLSGRLKEALADLEEHWARLGQGAQPVQAPPSPEE